MKKLPCINCPVLAICVAKKEIKCEILLNFLNRFYETSSYPHWLRMLQLLRKTLRGNWYVCGVNDKYLSVKRNKVLV